MGSEHASKVDMGAVQDEFQSVVTSGIKLLVSALETRLTPAQVAMTKIKWDVMEEMGEDTSPYMSEVAAKVREMMPQVRPLRDGPSDGKPNTVSPMQAKCGLSYGKPNTVFPTANQMLADSAH